LGIDTDKPFIKTQETTATTKTPVSSLDSIFHQGKLTLGATETQTPFTGATLQVAGLTRTVNSIGRISYDSLRNSSASIGFYIDPTLGNDNFPIEGYVNNSLQRFATLEKAIDVANQTNAKNVTFAFTGTSAAAPLIVNSSRTFLQDWVSLFCLDNNQKVVFNPTVLLTTTTGTKVLISNGTFECTTPFLDISEGSSLVFNQPFTLNMLGTSAFIIQHNATVSCFNTSTININATNSYLFRTIGSVYFKMSGFMTVNDNGFTPVHFAAPRNFTAGSLFRSTTNIFLSSGSALGSTNVLPTNVRYNDCIIYSGNRKFTGIEEYQAEFNQGAGTPFTTVPSRDGQAIDVNEGNIPARYSRIQTFNTNALAQAAGLQLGDLYKRGTDGALVVRDDITWATNGGGNFIPLVSGGYVLTTGAGVPYIVDSTLIPRTNTLNTWTATNNFNGIANFTSDVNITEPTGDANPITKKYYDDRDWDVYQPIISLTANVPTGGTMSFAGAGTGAGITQATRQTGDNYARAIFSTGTTATGRAGLISPGNSMLLDAGRKYEIYFRRFRVPATLTASAAIYIGYGDATTAEPVDGAYFRLNDLGGNTITCVTSSNSVRSASSPIAINAGQDYDLRIIATSTEVKFYVDEVLQSTLTTNLPTGAGRLFGINMVIISTAGTTARTFELDDFKFRTR
jgi:hypothetical protein